MLIAILVIGLLILGAVGLLARAVTHLAHAVSVSELKSRERHTSVIDLLRESTRHLVRESEIIRGYIGYELLEKRVLPTIGFTEPTSEVATWRVAAWPESSDAAHTTKT
jgi:hypothetical protein